MDAFFEKLNEILNWLEAFIAKIFGIVNGGIESVE